VAVSKIRHCECVAVFDRLHRLADAKAMKNGTDENIAVTAGLVSMTPMTPMTVEAASQWICFFCAHRHCWDIADVT
jgi:hypothetical protein